MSKKWQIPTFGEVFLRMCRDNGAVLPFLRSLYVVLTTYVRMSYVALSSSESTYTKNTRLKCEQHLGHELYIGQRSSENVVCAKPSPNVRESVGFGSCVARE